MSKTKVDSSQSKVLKTNDLSIMDQYRFHRLKQIIYKAYSQCHLKQPKIILINSKEMQMACRRHLNIIFVYLGLLENESTNSLKSDVYHEIGHYYADRIIKKHNLYPLKTQWWYRTPLQKKVSRYIVKKSELIITLVPIIFLLLCIEGFFIYYYNNMLSIIIGNVLAILLLTLMMLVPISLSMWTSLISRKPIYLYADNKKYRYLSEEVADEFALRHTHNFTASIDSLLSAWDEQMWKINYAKITPIKKRKQKIDAYQFIVLGSGLEHPSVHTRFARLRRFYNSHYQLW